MKKYKNSGRGTKYYKIFENRLESSRGAFVVALKRRKPRERSVESKNAEHYQLVVSSYYSYELSRFHFIGLDLLVMLC